MPQTSRSPVRRWGRRVLALLATIAVVSLTWHVALRGTAPLRAVRIVENGQAPPTPVPDERSMRLRVGTWNIAHGRGLAESNFGSNEAARLQRLRNIAAVLEAQDLDLVILNEVDFDCTWSHGVNQASFIAEAAGFSWWAEQRNVDTGAPFLRLAYGNALLSRHRIRSADRLEHDAASGLLSMIAGYKRTLLCEVEFYRRAVVLMSVHLHEHDAAARMSSALDIARAAEQHDLPVIAGGDLNAGASGQWPYSPGATALNSLLRSGVLKPDSAFGQSAPQMTWPADAPHMRLDWILAPSDWKVISSTVLNVQLSDHRPVIVELEAPDQW